MPNLRVRVTRGERGHVMVLFKAAPRLERQNAMAIRRLTCGRLLRRMARSRREVVEPIDSESRRDSKRIVVSKQSAHSQGSLARARGSRVGKLSSKRAWTRSRAAPACFVVLGTIRSAGAEEPVSWLQGEDASGDWGGYRSWLEQHGVHLDLDYSADSFARLAGRQYGEIVTYRGTLDLMLVLDTDLLGLWSGGTLFAYGQHGHGRGVSEGLGVQMPVNNLEAPDFTQLAELWYDQRFWGERLGIRIGKQDANRDFAAARFPGNFLHSSFGVLPTVPMPSFPAPGLGAVVFVDPEPWLSLRSGVYEGNPQIESVGVERALEHGGSFFIGSALLRQDFGEQRPQAGIYSIGAWYGNRDGVRANQASSENFGAFAVADLLVRLAPDDPADSRSVQAFIRVGWAPSDRNPVALYMGGGATYHGLRGNDTLGMGAGQARFPTDAATPGHAESFLELFYKARFARWFTMQPDLQLVLTPSGADRGALVGGVRFKLKL